MSQQRPLARGTDARQPVEHRGRHGPVAALAVVGDREPVGFVAESLEQLELGRVMRERQREPDAPG